MFAFVFMYAFCRPLRSCLKENRANQSSSCIILSYTQKRFVVARFFFFLIALFICVFYEGQSRKSLENIDNPYCLSVHALASNINKCPEVCQNLINVFKIYIRINVTPTSIWVALLGNQFAEMCFSGTGKGCPSDIEARQRTTRTDFYPATGFYSDSRKKRHWQRHRHCSVYMSLSASVSLMPCSLQLRWLASIFPFFPSPSPFLECQPQASQSRQKPLQAGAARHMSAPMLSEPHIHNLKKEMRDSGCVGWHFLNIFYLFTFFIYWPI